MKTENEGYLKLHLFLCRISTCLKLLLLLIILLDTNTELRLVMLPSTVHDNLFAVYLQMLSTSQRIFPKCYLPKEILPSGNFPNVPLGASEDLTKSWEVSTLEIFTWEVTLGKCLRESTEHLPTRLLYAKLFLILVRLLGLTAALL